MIDRGSIHYIIECFLLVVAVNDTTCSSYLSWRCDNGECIDFTERCNGQPDCTDGSDETMRECISFQCTANKFRCAYGACVNATVECDTHKDCVDNSDELTAKCLPNVEISRRGKCSVEEFQCASGACIAIEDLCDGKRDCGDDSDETVAVCASKCCPPFGFRCGYGACIDERERCNGVADCADASDENAYLCGYHNPSHRRPGANATRPHDTDHGDDDDDADDDEEENEAVPPKRQRPGLISPPALPSANKVQCFSYTGK